MFWDSRGSPEPWSDLGLRLEAVGFGIGTSGLSCGSQNLVFRGLGGLGGLGFRVSDGPVMV